MNSYISSLLSNCSLGKQLYITSEKTSSVVFHKVGQLIFFSITNVVISNVVPNIEQMPMNFISSHLFISIIILFIIIKYESGLEIDFCFYLPTNSSINFWPFLLYPNMSFIGLGDRIFKISVKTRKLNAYRVISK